MTVADALTKAIQAAKGDVDEAVKLARKYLEADAAAWDSFLEKALRDAVHAQMTAGGVKALGTVGGKNPHRAPGKTTAASDALIRGYEQMASDTLMEYRLRSGKRLADSRRAEVLAEAEWHADLGRVRQAYAEWLRLIAASLSSPDHIVSGRLTEGQLQAMRVAAGKRVR